MAWYQGLYFKSGVRFDLTAVQVVERSLQQPTFYQLFKDKWYRRGGDKKNVKCLCKNGQNGDPAWKKSCSWSFQNAPWMQSDVDNVQCKPAGFQPPPPSSYEITRYDLRFKGWVQTFYQKKPGVFEKFQNDS